MSLQTKRVAGAVAVVTVLSLLTGCQTGDMSAQLAMRQKVADQSNNIASLSEIIKANPRDANALNMRGAAYGQVGEYEKALADFNAAIAINPQYFQAYSNRALVYMRAKRPEHALADYNQALGIEPKYGPALIGRGNIHGSKNDHQAAIADYTAALEIQADPVAHFQRGLSRQTLGQHAQAIDDFDNTLGFRPDAPEVFHAKGVSELALQKYQKAYEDFYQAARGKENNFEAWALRGRAAEGMGQKKEAAQAYRRALQINPSYKPARDGLDRVESDA